MSRPVSERFREAAYAQETGEVVVHLLTLTHPTLAEPIRLSSDPTERISVDPLLYATTSRGEQYLFLPFDMVLPADRDDAPPRLELQIDNIDRGLVALLRSVTVPLAASVELVLAASPDLVEAAYPALRFASVSYDERVITVQLVLDGMDTEPWPAGLMTAGRFPGLF